MAIYTREDAKNSARYAKKEPNYFIVVAMSKDFKRYQVKNLATNEVQVADALDVYHRELDWLTVALQFHEVKKRFPYANTIKDLEVIFYQLVNYKIQELQKSIKGRQSTSAPEKEIYFSNIGYNSVRFRFYVKVRETDKTIWLQRVDKKVVEGHPQNGKVVPDTNEVMSDVFSRRKGEHSIKIDDYEFAQKWDGKPMQEYSD